MGASSIDASEYEGGAPAYRGGAPNGVEGRSMLGQDAREWCRTAEVGYLFRYSI
jgi:hypothetical protein